MDGIKNFLKNLLKPTSFKRTVFFLVSDILIAIFSLYFAFLIRFDFSLPPQYVRLFVIAFPFFIFIKIALFYIFNLYKISWRYVSLLELLKIGNSTLIATLVLVSSVFALRNYTPFSKILPLKFYRAFSSIPISVVFIDSLLFFIATSTLRISKRFYLEIIKGRQIKKGLRTIIVGAGNVGEMVLRDIKRQNYTEFYPIGFLDDDKRKIGAYIHNIKVLDSIENLEKIVKDYNVEAIIIAINSLSHKKLTKIYIEAKNCGVKTIKIIPKIYDVEKPEITLKKLEDIKIEDLLARQAVRTDFKKVESFLKGKRVLTTGAGGSIGSEIVMHALQFNPSELILLDIDETELFNMEVKISKIPYSGKLHFIVGDIRDFEKMNKVFERFKPDIVFHAAAYKHVPMMEYNPDEAVKVNIFGTYNLAKLSTQYNVERFVLISTDKAVKPKSVMGATKRVAEYICKAFNDSCKTEFISVRFGNVIGSRGSVLPVWLEQLKQGGPLTVTHPDMKRYFMTIPEAVSLVLLASAVGKGGEIMVLDMGEPVRIIDLAETFIRIHGLEPYKDIDIKFTGIRPGENLFEDILTAEEGTIATKYEKIFIAKENKNLSINEIENFLDNIGKIMINGNSDLLIKKILQDFCKKITS